MAADSAARWMERRYYLAMAVPFALDVVITVTFATILWLPQLLLPNLLTGFAALLLAVHIGARMLFRPIRLYLDGQAEFAAIERRLTQLPLRSATLVAYCYLPILLWRIVAPLVFAIWLPGLVFSGVPRSTWTDAIATLIVSNVFIFVVVYFIVSGYLERLCVFMFERRGMNLGLFFGSFQRKMGVALGFMSVAPLALVAADVASYTGERLLREVAVDFATSAFGLGVTLFWVARSLTRPLARLDEGMGKVTEGDFDVRLPVTSNEEVGELTSRFNDMVAGLRERNRIRATFGKYVSESVATALLRDAGDGRLAGETRVATVMFTDIEGFTTLSEHLPPHTLIAALNEYLEVVLEPIQAHGGVVNSFIGDGLFASFNLPLANEQHASSAIAAALAIQRALRERVFAGSVRLRTRIGINTGTVVGGTVGAGDRLSYTLLGDAVNTAARLEELNKVHGTGILITGATLQAAGDAYAAKRIGEVPIRGRSETLEIFSVDEA